VVRAPISRRFPLTFGAVSCKLWRTTPEQLSLAIVRQSIAMVLNDVHQTFRWYRNK
jgi:hypothetical protein